MRGPLKRMRWMLYVVGALTLAVVGPLAFECLAARAEYAADAATLPAESARARALGLALTWEELTPLWAETDANAAPIYAKAFAEQKLVPSSVGEKLYPLPPAAPEGWNDLGEALQASSKVLALLEQAAERPHCWFERNRSGVEVGGGFVDATSLRNAARLVCARAQFEAHEGRFDAALGSLQVAATIARHAGDDTGLIGWLAKIGDDSIVLRTLESIASPAEMTPARLERARLILEGLGSPSLVPGYRGELVSRIRIFDVLREDGRRETMYDQPSGWERLQSWWDGVKATFRPDPDRIDMSAFQPRFQDTQLVERAYQARELHRWNPFFEAARTRDGAPEAIVRALADVQTALESGDHRADRPARVFPPLTEDVGKAYLKAIARRRLAAQALTVWAFKHRTGNWPATLAEAGEVQLDPFDGKPLRHIAGRRLYSIGEDGRDDGGGKADVVFALHE